MTALDERPLYADVPGETYWGLVQIAERRGVSMKSVLVKAIDQYIAADSRKRKKRNEQLTLEEIS